MAPTKQIRHLADLIAAETHVGDSFLFSSSDCRFGQLHVPGRSRKCSFKLMVHLMGAVAARVVLGATVLLFVNSRTDPIDARLASIEVADKLAAWQVSNSR
ncbi:hypothetical protein [Bradyrhizobium sp. SYSU BS000235]|uniref:hypothetical protein n=1 Tax=Bradyrhizobium sp. SYSU BS000235 TaxID=3411332 RepID=UPI003C736824